ARASTSPLPFEAAAVRVGLREFAAAFAPPARQFNRLCEDSVIRAAFPIRRSRGFAPDSLPLPEAVSEPILATGAELKSTFCVARGSEAFLSPHLGDLDTEAAYRGFRGDLDLYLEMLAVRPEVIAHDLHPDYLSTRWALEQE